MEGEKITGPPDATGSGAASSSDVGTPDREIPIARNANPAGVSTARTVTEMEAAEGSAKQEKASSEQAKEDYPIARNANPSGVSTARTQE